jgi:hypothetical protein
VNCALWKTLGFGNSATSSSLLTTFSARLAPASVCSKAISCDLFPSLSVNSLHNFTCACHSRTWTQAATQLAASRV